MDVDYKSRTKKKNEARALQKLGEKLVTMPLSKIKTMNLPDDLLNAIEFVHTIKSHGARRREIQHIGAIMRHIDPEPIKKALSRIQSGDSVK